MGTTPEGVAEDPLKCAGTLINGLPGIFTREGDWLNLKTLDWQSFAPVPYDCNGSRPNAMWGYQGKPTVFGSAFSSGPGNCYYDQVMQYQAEEDKWNIIGTMLIPRKNHEVVEVPKTFCDLLN